MMKSKTCLLISICFVWLIVDCVSKQETQQVQTKHTRDSLAVIAKQQLFEKKKADVLAQKASIKVAPVKIDPSLDGAAISTSRNIILIVDDSGSMGDRPQGDCGAAEKYPTKMKGAIAAVLTFLEHAPVDDRIGICDINGRVVASLGTSRERLCRCVSEMYPQHNTPLGHAIIRATDILVRQCQMQLGYGDYRIVAFTDGEATDKYVPEGVTYATQHGIPVYVIGLCTPEDIEIRFWADWYQTVSLDGLADALQETLAEAVD